MSIKFSNNASTIPTASISNVATSFAVLDGSIFPTTTDGYFYITVTEGGLREIMRVTTRSGNTFSVVERAKDGTTAQNFTTGARVELRLPNVAIQDVSPFGNEFFWMYA